MIPGLELTFNDPEPVQAAHAVAVGLRQLVSVDDGIAEAMRTAAEAAPRSSRRIRTPTSPPSCEGASPSASLETQALRDLAHRFELFNRSQLFGWVAEAGLPAVATGDVHRAEHAFGWKTLLPTRHDESAVVEYLRSSRPVYLARLDAETSRAAA